MKAAIIGSRGFIGSNLVDYYSKLGWEVFGADVVSDYNSVNYYQVDATNADYKEVFKQNTFDVCINASGAASVPDSFERPSRDFHLNTNNVFKLLEAIREYAPTCKFLNLSSAAVYGNPGVLPIDEESPSIPLSPYGSHKKLSESLCKEYQQFFGLKTCSVRIFSAYGPGLKKQMFWDLYQKSKSSNEISLLGSGEESRDYIFVDDIANALKMIVLDGNFDASIYNLGGGKEISIKQAAETFFTLLDPEIKFSFSGVIRAGDPVNWCADISKLKSIGFQPGVTLEEGLNRYIKWLKNV